MLIENEVELLSLIECIRNSQTPARRQALRSMLFSPDLNITSVNYWHLRVIFEHRNERWGFEWKDKLGTTSCIKLIIYDRTLPGWRQVDWATFDFDFTTTIVQAARDLFSGNVAL